MVVATYQRNAVPKSSRLLIFFTRIQELIDARVKALAAHLLLLLCSTSLHMLILKNALRKTWGKLKALLNVFSTQVVLSMGVNLAAMQYVIHYGPPRTAEAFLQESRRVGRDQTSQGHSTQLHTLEWLRGGSLMSRWACTLKLNIVHVQCY